MSEWYPITPSSGVGATHSKNLDASPRLDYKRSGARVGIAEGATDALIWSGLVWSSLASVSQAALRTKAARHLSASTAVLVSVFAL